MSIMSDEDIRATDVETMGLEAVQAELRSTAAGAQTQETGDDAHLGHRGGAACARRYNHRSSRPKVLAPVKIAAVDASRSQHLTAPIRIAELAKSPVRSCASARLSSDYRAWLQIDLSGMGFCDDTPDRRS